MYRGLLSSYRFGTTSVVSSNELEITKNGFIIFYVFITCLLIYAPLSYLLNQGEHHLFLSFFKPLHPASTDFSLFIHFYDSLCFSTFVSNIYLYNAIHFRFYGTENRNSTIKKKLSIKQPRCNLELHFTAKCNSNSDTRVLKVQTYC